MGCNGLNILEADGPRPAPPGPGSDIPAQAKASIPGTSLLRGGLGAEGSRRLLWLPPRARGLLSPPGRASSPPPLQTGSMTRSGAAVRPSWKLRVWRTRQWGLKGQLATTSRRPLRRAGDTGLSHTCRAPGRGTAGGSASARVGGCDRHTHLCGKTGDGGPTSKTAPGCGPRVAPAFSVTPFWVFPGFLQCVHYFSNQRSLKLPSRLGAVFDVLATVCPPEPGFCNVPRSQLGSRDSGSRGPRTEQQQLSQKREGPRTLPGLSGQRSTPREPPGARNTEHKARGPGRKA